MKLSTFLDIIDPNRTMYLSDILKNRQSEFLNEDGDIDWRIGTVIASIRSHFDTNTIQINNEIVSLPFYYLIKEVGISEDGILDITKDQWCVWKAKAYLTGLCTEENYGKTGI